MNRETWKKRLKALTTTAKKDTSASVIFQAGAEMGIPMPTPRVNESGKAFLERAGLHLEGYA